MSFIVKPFDLTLGTQVPHLPRLFPVGDFQTGGVADELVEGADDFRESGAGGPVPLPAVQHELMQRGGAVRRGGEPVVLLYGVDHLERQDT